MPKPATIRRHERRLPSSTPEVIRFQIKSLTDLTGQLKYRHGFYHGLAHCECPDFRYRKEVNEPDMHDPDHKLCKHLVRARNLSRSREEFSVPRCICCDSVSEPLHKVADDHGRPIHGARICNHCIQPDPFSGEEQ